MILPPASLQAAASVPIPSSSIPYGAGAAAKQVGGNLPGDQVPGGRATASKEDSAKAAVTNQLKVTTSAGDETQSVDSTTGSTPEQAFADIIQQLSSQSQESSSSAPQPSGSSPNPRLLRGWQVVAPAEPAKGTAIITLAKASVPVAPTATPQTPEKKPTPSGTSRTEQAPAPAAKDHTQEAHPVPVEVAALLPLVKPRLAELKSSGGVSEVEPRPHAVHAPPVKEDAALNVVIRTNNQADQAAEPVSDSAAPEQVPAAPASPATKTQDGAMSPTAPSGDTSPVSSATPAVSSQTVAAPPVISPVASEPEHRKSSGGTDSITPDIAPAKPFAAQTAAFQDLQLKAEPAKNGAAAPRAVAQTTPVAAPERLAPEKNAPQPVKSVALEFTPDGTRDVKVRLSERGGEVHVSVHSTDPTITRSLREGVSDLATVLEHAGYDAKAWTNDRQQQGNPQQQQQDEQARQRRNNRFAGGGQQFESILQQPNQENS